MSAQNLTRKNLSCGPFSNNSFNPPFFSGNFSEICLMSTAYEQTTTINNNNEQQQ